MGGSQPSRRRTARWERLLEWALRLLSRLWLSHEPLDAYLLVQMMSGAGDAMVAIALADSVFFSVPVGQAKVKVALYLLLTMAPLAAAAPALVPLLDLGGFLRTIAFGAAAGRAILAVYAAPRFTTLLLFPLAFLLLVLSKVSSITKNGLVMAYAPAREGLVTANARLGRYGVIGGLLAAPAGVAMLKVAHAKGVLYLAAIAYGVTALLTLRLARPKTKPVRKSVQRVGAIPRLREASIGTAGLKAASGFLFFMLAFALRGRHYPAYWFGVLAASAAGGGFLGDVAAPRLSRYLREEAVVYVSLGAAGVAALFAFTEFRLVILAFFTAFAGMATEFGRLSFQSLMQRYAPEGSHGRVFVRYEVLFQLSWVSGAFLPAVLPIPFRTGVLFMAAFYIALGLYHVVRPIIGRWEQRPTPPPAAHG